MRLSAIDHGIPSVAVDPAGIARCWRLSMSPVTKPRSSPSSTEASARHRHDAGFCEPA